MEDDKVIKRGGLYYVQCQACGIWRRYCEGIECPVCALPFAFDLKKDEDGGIKIHRKRIQRWKKAEDLPEVRTEDNGGS